MVRLHVHMKAEGVHHSLCSACSPALSLLRCLQLQ